MKPPRLDLNPSSADRWTTCTASPHFVMENWDKLPPSDNKFSQEGTTAHEVAAAYLQNRKPKPEACPTPVDAAMRLHGWDYMEYVRGLISPGGTLTVERKFPLWYMPERNAMIDALVSNPENIHIVDYKYGAGIIVSPVENLQGAIYARTVVNGGDFRLMADDFPISIHIFQPRNRNSDEPHSVWESTWGEIKAFTDARVWEPAKLILNSKALDPVTFLEHVDLQFAPSDKACQWCPCRGFCEARMKALTEGIDLLAVIDDSPKHFLPAKAISVAQLSAILKHKSDIEKWLKDAEEWALEFMEGGGKIPGHKLVLSRGGKRFWTDPKKAAKLLLEHTVLKREEVIEDKTVSPAAVEKLLGKGKMDVEITALIGKPPGSPCIAPEDDKREEIGSINPADEFADDDKPPVV